MNIIPDKNTLILLRFPFSLLLMPLFILALSQSTAPQAYLVICSFLIIHILVYPASNGYNSYVDKDETSIGGLEKPPKPTKKLFYTTLIMDIVAIMLSYIIVSNGFAICILVYILMSRAYSSRIIRLKKHPVVGFLTVVIFQGAFTYYMCSVGISRHLFEFSSANLLILAACSFQIAGIYPLTQIYQHKEDVADGVITISYKLGYKGTFIFSAIMFICCNVFYYMYFRKMQRLDNFLVIQLFYLPIVLYFIYWFLKVIKNSSEANFKHTMQMNVLAAISMNICFTILYFVNH